MTLTTMDHARITVECTCDDPQSRNLYIRKMQNGKRVMIPVAVMCITCGQIGLINPAVRLLK